MNKTVLFTSITAGALSIVALMGFATASTLNAQAADSNPLSSYHLTIDANNCTIENGIMTVKTDERKNSITFNTDLEIKEIDGVKSFYDMNVQRNKPKTLLKNIDMIAGVKTIEVKHSNIFGRKSDLSLNTDYIANGDFANTFASNKIDDYNHKFDLSATSANFIDLKMVNNNFGTNSIAVEKIVITFDCSVKTGK